jgi:hypothetical protein
MTLSLDPGARRRALLCLLALAGCRSDVAVDIETSVGSEAHRDDPKARLADVRAVAEALWLPAAAPSVATTAPAGPARPPASTDDLTDLTTAIRKGAIDEIGGPARRIAASPPSLWSQIRTALAAPRKATKGDYRSMLAAIGGDVPNKYGHFDLAWKKAHGFAVKRSEDWFEDLLVLPRGKLSPMLVGVYRDCVLQTSLLQAASKIGAESMTSKEVVDALLEAAYQHDGIFRDEVSRAIVRIGDEAVPHLWRATIVVDDRNEAQLQRAEFAAVQLDKMDRWIPERAEAALATEPRRLAALLDVWGEARNGNAAAIMLAHADSRVPKVRDAARRAFSSLVDGPPPKTVSRRVRLLGGGTGQAQAFLNYRQRAGIAVREALARTDSSLIEAPCEPAVPGTPLDPHCDAQPSRHAASLFALLDARREAQSKAAIDAAMATGGQSLAQLDRLLAERPELGDEPRVAAAYRHGAAEALGRGDALAGAALSRKAAVLLGTRDPEAADTLRVQALLAEADSGAVPPLGREMLLRTAAQLRPDHPRVVAALEASPTMDTVGVATIAGDRLALGCACVVLAFACVGGVTRRRAPRASVTAASEDP